MGKMKTHVLLLFLFTVGCLSYVSKIEVMAVQVDNKLMMNVDDGEEIDPPYHPINPSDPTIPETPDFPSSDGPLSINYVSTLSFSHQKATGRDTLYTSERDVLYVGNQKEEVPNFIQISDHRGSNSGWKLAVKQSRPFENGKHILKGTEIYLQDVTLGSLNPERDTSPKISKQKITLIPDGDYISFVVADKNQGMGTWLIRFGQNNTSAPEGVQLFVPGKSSKEKGTYKTSLSWLLIDTPSE